VDSFILNKTYILRNPRPLKYTSHINPRPINFLQAFTPNRTELNSLLQAFTILLHRPYPTLLQAVTSNANQMKRVMLHIILLSSFCHPKIDVALKITIGSKSNGDLS
jgi:hypothetical protein